MENPPNLIDRREVASLLAANEPTKLQNLNKKSGYADARIPVHRLTQRGDYVTVIPNQSTKRVIWRAFSEECRSLARKSEDVGTPRGRQNKNAAASQTSSCGF
jgi:hypothetical protein